MGATDFQTYAAGKTPADAFRAARENAQYQSGHGGYTGTIAEKGDFVHVPVPKGITLAGFVKLMDDAEEHVGIEYLRETVRYARQHGQGARKKYGDKTLKQHEAELARAERRAEQFWTRVRGRGPGVEQALRRALEVGGWGSDKWGPALCLGPVTGKLLQERLQYVSALSRGHRLYLFRGIASC